MFNEKILLKELPEIQKRILELLESQGPLGISAIATLTKANRNTLKKALSSLVSANYINMSGIGKATRYGLV